MSLGHKNKQPKRECRISVQSLLIDREEAETGPEYDAWKILGVNSRSQSGFDLPDANAERKVPNKSFRDGRIRPPDDARGISSDGKIRDGISDKDANPSVDLQKSHISAQACNAEIVVGIPFPCRLRWYRFWGRFGHTVRQGRS